MYIARCHLETPTESVEDHLRGPTGMKIQLQWGGLHWWIKEHATEVRRPNEIKWNVNCCGIQSWVETVKSKQTIG